MKKPIDVLKDTRDLVTDPGSQVHWVKLVIAFFGLVAISFGLATLMNLAKSRLNIDLFQFELLAYISVFAAALLANLTIIAPVPFAIAIMVSAAQNYNPVIVALCGAVGGSFGELSGYYAGYWGRKIAVPDCIVGYKRIEGWVSKYGPWAIMVISFQPIIPFDVGGIIAGAAKMPIYKFLPALFAGKFPKYLLLIYAGLGAISFLPHWLQHFLGSG
jgi:membrane protein YqaA with SNARE-associated domain